MATIGSQITNTLIDSNVYDGRALITHRTGSLQCLRRPNGELWAVLVRPGGWITQFISRDQGFSWIRTDADPSTTTQLNNVNTFFTNGPHVNLVISEDYERVQYIFPDNNTTVIQGVSIPLDDFDNLTDFTTTNFTVVNTGAGAAKEQYFRIASNETNTYIWYILTSNDRPTFKRISPRDNQLSAATSVVTSPVARTLGLCVNKNSQVDVLWDILVSSTHRIRHLRYDEASNTATSEHEIIDLGASGAVIGVDLDIGFDSYGTLCATYTAVNTTSQQTTLYYAISTDSGTTWTNTALTRGDGNSAYVDIIKNQGAGRNTVIGSSSGGFIIGYTEKFHGVPKAYVRRITTDDGITYTLGDQKMVATHLPSTTSVVGPRFFHPINSALMDLDDPGLVRIAYQIGEGEADDQSDAHPIDIGQELLYLTAYPTALDSENGSYTNDTGSSTSLLVDVNILGAGNDNIDYYAAGKTGNQTTRYKNAFNRIGTSIRLLKYEPNSTSFMDDRTAYGAATEYEALCIFQPESYGFPNPQLSGEDQLTYIEQDIRKLYLPPDFFLSREFITNSGGYVKRTVWLCQFGGNEYELSQVVPHFISNQICYYEANAYVVGPSRDPFSRLILPSET